METRIRFNYRVPWRFRLRTVFKYLGPSPTSWELAKYRHPIDPIKWNQGERWKYHSTPEHAPIGVPSHSSYYELSYPTCLPPSFSTPADFHATMLHFQTSHVIYSTSVA